MCRRTVIMVTAIVILSLTIMIIHRANEKTIITNNLTIVEGQDNKIKDSQEEFFNGHNNIEDYQEETIKNEVEIIEDGIIGDNSLTKVVKQQPKPQIAGSNSQLKKESQPVEGNTTNNNPEKFEKNHHLGGESIQPAENNSTTKDFNQYVLDIIKTYPINSNSYPYLLNNDYANYNGVTMDITYKGRVLLRAHPSGNRASHCSGITFEVFFRGMQERNRQLGLSPDDFNGMTFEELTDFMLLWYAALGPKSQSNITVAVEKYQMGKRIHNLEDAKAGDFIDISRTNNTGHTAVFIDWIREDGKIVGLKYWSSQESTNGIAYNVEYFNVRRNNGQTGNVIINQVYIARIF